jgi:hypothetical protein
MLPNCPIFFSYASISFSYGAQSKPEIVASEYLAVVMTLLNIGEGARRLISVNPPHYSDGSMRELTESTSDVNRKTRICRADSSIHHVVHCDISQHMQRFVDKFSAIDIGN